MLTPLSCSPASKSPPQISGLAKAFVDSLTASQLSDFLVWMLYHEFVDLPEDAEAWYDPISRVDMRGWVALGQYLAASDTTLDTSHGFDIVVMDSICDRLGLQRSTVHGFLRHFANEEKMAFSQIATLVRVADAEEQHYIDMLDNLYARLNEIFRMAVRLKPTEGSVYDYRHTIIMKRLRGFLSLVIEPRIANIRSGAPLVTAATSDQTHQVVKDGMRPNYLFELMQQKRPVPVARYRIDQAQTRQSLGLATPPSSPPETHAYITPKLSHEEHTNAQLRLYKENQYLRAQLSALQQDMRHVQIANDTLAHKLVLLGHDQTATPTPIPTLSPTQAEHAPGQVDTNTYLHGSLLIVARKSPEPRPRSISYNATPTLSSSTDTNTKYNHKRRRSEFLSSKYKDVFTALDPPSPSVRSSDPAAGELLPPLFSSPNTDEDEEVGIGSSASHASLQSASLNSPSCSPSRAATFATGPGRRSGMVFSKGQMEMLRFVREATPMASRNEEKLWADWSVDEDSKSM